MDTWALGTSDTKGPIQQPPSAWTAVSVSEQEVTAGLPEPRVLGRPAAPVRGAFTLGRREARPHSVGAAVCTALAVPHFSSA